MITAIMVLFQGNFFLIFPVTVFTGVTYLDFETLNLFGFEKRFDIKIAANGT